MIPTARKVVLIRRPTRLDQLVARFNSVQQAQFYVEHIGGDFLDYEAEHRNYYASLSLLVANIDQVSRMHIIDWLQVPNYQFGKDDVVATIGQDGLIANALKYLESQTIIGFNSDPARWDGSLAQFKPEEAAGAIESCMDGKIDIKEITKAVVQLSDEQELQAVNDFFIGVSNHASARYRLSYRHKEESHSSSGVIVSTPLGRSAWMKSVLTGAKGIMDKLQGKKRKIVETTDADDWAEDCLYFAVREPFPSVSSDTELVFGKITEFGDFRIESKMGENGVVFSDGMQSDSLNFNYSVRAAFSLAKTKGRLAVRA